MPVPGMSLPVDEKRLLARRPRSGICYRDLILKTQTDTKSQTHLRVPTPRAARLCTKPPTPASKTGVPQEHHVQQETIMLLDSEPISRPKSFKKTSTTASSKFLTVNTDMVKAHSDENIRDSYKRRGSITTLQHSKDSSKEVLKSNPSSYPSFNGRRRHSIAGIETQVNQPTSLLAKRAESAHSGHLKYNISSANSNSEQELRDHLLVPILKGTRRRSMGEIFRFDMNTSSSRNNHHVRFTDDVIEIKGSQRNAEV